MQLIALKSPRINVHDDLNVVLLKTLDEHGVLPQSGDILVIASKVVAYSQGLLREVDSDQSFRQLIFDEAEQVLDEGVMVLTMKNNILIPNAGIDRSNTPDGKAILWPSEPFEAARQIRLDVMKEFHLNQFGVVISDSHCQPLRQGTTGMAIGWAGFEGVQDERGNQDLYGHEMVYTQIAMADNLASAATLLMGETNASVPFVLARQAPVKFSEKEFNSGDYFVPPSACLFKPLYSYRLREN